MRLRVCDGLCSSPYTSRATMVLFFLFLTWLPPTAHLGPGPGWRCDFDGRPLSPTSAHGQRHQHHQSHGRQGTNISSSPLPEAPVRMTGKTGAATTNFCLFIRSYEHIHDGIQPTEDEPAHSTRPTLYVFMLYTLPLTLSVATQLKKT